MTRLTSTQLSAACISVLLLSTAMGSSALTAGDSYAKSSPNTPNDRTVIFDAGFSRWLSAPHTVEMSQGVSFQQGEATLKTDSAIVYLDSDSHAQTAKSLSTVRLSDPSNDLTGDVGEIDFIRHIASLHGHVTLVTKHVMTDEGISDPSTMTCDAMTYNYRTKVGSIPGALTVRQADRILLADSGVYDTSTRTITLTGNVHGHDTKGNQLSGPTATVLITPGHEEVTLQGPIHGSFPVSDDATTSVPAKSAHPVSEQRSSP